MDVVHMYLTTGSEFQKTFHDLISFYKTCKSQVNHLKNKRDLGHRNSRKWLPEVGESVSSQPNIFWYYKKTLSTDIGLVFKQTFWKFRFLRSLPLTNGSDGRLVQPHCARLLSEIYHPWKQLGPRTANMAMSIC